MVALALAGCVSTGRRVPGEGLGDLGRVDLASADLASADLGSDDGLDASALSDGGMNQDSGRDAGADLALADLAHADLAHPDLAHPDLSSGVITGGACLSGATGATAFRVRWADGGNTAYPVYEVSGLPDPSRSKAGAYGYQIGFTASYVDPFLAQGGLQLDSSDFIDLELSSVGVTTIRSATLALYGRSYNTTASGSFNWQTFEGTGATNSDSVANSAPYAWYGGDVAAVLSPGDNKILIRIKAGPSSSSLVVNRVELCLDAS